MPSTTKTRPFFDIVVPRNLTSTIEGFEFLAAMSLSTYNFEKRTIKIDFLSNDLFDANLCSPLGSLLEDLGTRRNKIIFSQLQESAESAFKTNGFYSFIDKKFKQLKNYVTIIDYRKFSLQDTTPFQEYIKSQLLDYEDFPIMSQLLKQKINKSIFEIFNNAHIHGACDNVFTCGQYFEKEQKLKFSISDMGISIRKNVNDFFNSGNKIDGIDAIDWAVKEGNTTKKGSIPGGLGLSLIRDFLKLNEGALQIISSNGFWEERNGIIFTKVLKQRFLGTIVNLEFNLNDPKSYALQSELNLKDIL